MRLTTENLVRITGYKFKSMQAKWFLDNLGVDVPVDRYGVIMTDSAYEKLLEKRLGLGASLAIQEDRPRLKSQRSN